MVVYVKRPFERVFQSVSRRLQERGRKKREKMDERKMPTTHTRTYCKCSRALSYCSTSVGRPGTESFSTPSHHPTTPGLIRSCDECHLCAETRSTIILIPSHPENITALENERFLLKTFCNCSSSEIKCL